MDGGENIINLINTRILLSTSISDYSHLFKNKRTKIIRGRKPLKESQTFRGRVSRRDNSECSRSIMSADFHLSTQYRERVRVREPFFISILRFETGRPLEDTNSSSFSWINSGDPTCIQKVTVMRFFRGLLLIIVTPCNGFLSFLCVLLRP